MSDNKKDNDNLLQILNSVSESLSSSHEGSLWEKIREEMQSSGSNAALQYMKDEFTRNKSDFEQELQSLKEVFGRRAHP